jgi:hypothetical protein
VGLDDPAGTDGEPKGASCLVFVLIEMEMRTIGNCRMKRKT